MCNKLSRHEFIKNESWTYIQSSCEILTNLDDRYVSVLRN